MGRPDFPLAAIEGAGEVKTALLLLAVDPGLQGLLIRGVRGSGKTVLARSIRPVLRAIGVPFVEVPAATAEDRLLGGIDWSATLAAGERRISRGLLAQANGGVLFIDHVNLLPLGRAAHIAGALNSGAVRLERDGVSAELPACFAVLGSYDPEEGEPAALLRDAVGMQVEVEGSASLVERGEIATRALAYQAERENFARRYADETARAVECVAWARRLLPAVTIDAESRRRICEMAVQFGVEGHRAEIFAIRAARAHAALGGHSSVGERDLDAAIRLSLAPRSKWGRLSAGRRPAGEGAGAENAGTAGAGSSGGREPARGRNAECAASPIDNPAPPLSEPGARAGAAAGRGRARRSAESYASRGRYVRAVASDPGHGVVAVDATLRAAARFQKARQPGGVGVRIAAADLRYKQFRRKAGIEIIFALDASGSMAANRIQQAKGAVIRLLREAYVHRDIVALVGFRGDSAEVLMKPGRSVELARRALDDLPTGGGTPLASGILAALELVRRAVRPALLVLLTDGRPNTSRTGQPVWTELERVAAAVRESQVVSMVIDTSRGRPVDGGAERLAGMLGARYVVLPRMDSAGVFGSVAEAAAAMRG